MRAFVLLCVITVSALMISGCGTRQKSPGALPNDYILRAFGFDEEFSAVSLPYQKSNLGHTVNSVRREDGYSQTLGKSLPAGIVIKSRTPRILQTGTISQRSVSANEAKLQVFDFLGISHAYMDSIEVDFALPYAVAFDLVAARDERTSSIPLEQIVYSELWLDSFSIKIKDISYSRQTLNAQYSLEKLVAGLDTSLIGNKNISLEYGTGGYDGNWRVIHMRPGFYGVNISMLDTSDLSVAAPAEREHLSPPTIVIESPIADTSVYTVPNTFRLAVRIEDSLMGQFQRVRQSAVLLGNRKSVLYDTYDPWTSVAVNASQHGISSGEQFTIMMNAASDFRSSSRPLKFRLRDSTDPDIKLTIPGAEDMDGIVRVAQDIPTLSVRAADDAGIAAITVTVIDRGKDSADTLVNERYSAPLNREQAFSRPLVGLQAGRQYLIVAHTTDERGNRGMYALPVRKLSKRPPAVVWSDRAASVRVLRSQSVLPIDAVVTSRESPIDMVSLMLYDAGKKVWDTIASAKVFDDLQEANARDYLAWRFDDAKESSFRIKVCATTRDGYQDCSRERFVDLIDDVGRRPVVLYATPSSTPAGNFYPSRVRVFDELLPPYEKVAESPVNADGAAVIWLPLEDAHADGRRQYRVRWYDAQGNQMHDSRLSLDLLEQ